MIRMLSAGIGIALVAGSASAAFVGIDIREDKTIDPMAEMTADPGGLGLRVFNFYALFDGPGEIGNTGNGVNKVLSVGQDSSADSFGINMSDGANDGASFYQELGFAGDLPPNPALIGVFPEIGLDSYVGLGNKTAAPGTDSTAVDPDFSFTADRVFGGWFNSGGDNGQNVASELDSKFAVFIGQFTTLGLDDGVQLGSFQGGTPAGGGEDGDFTFASDIFDGEFNVFTQQENGGALVQKITFEKIPTPSALAVFGVAGLAAGRRRRSA